MVCNDARWFSFDYEMLFEALYPLHVIAGFCMCHIPHPTQS